MMMTHGEILFFKTISSPVQSGPPLRFGLYARSVNQGWLFAVGFIGFDRSVLLFPNLCRSRGIGLIFRTQRIQG